MPALRDAIERLYLVFAGYRAGHVPGCPCCVSSDEQKRLHSRRLRDLAAADLEHFSFSALNTWGTPNDFKHFLPRILELHAQRELMTDLQTIVGKVHQEGRWPDPELHAVMGFAAALFDDVVARGSASELSTIIESAGILGMDVTSLLERAFSARPLAPSRATILAELVTLRQDALTSGEPRWIWWKAEGAGALDAWLLSGRAHAALLSAFLTAPDDPDAGTWAASCDIVDALGGAEAGA